MFERYHQKNKNQVVLGTAGINGLKYPSNKVKASIIYHRELCVGF